MACSTDGWCALRARGAGRLAAEHTRATPLHACAAWAWCRRRCPDRHHPPTYVRVASTLPLCAHPTRARLSIATMGRPMAAAACTWLAVAAVALAATALAQTQGPSEAPGGEAPVGALASPSPASSLETEQPIILTLNPATSVRACVRRAHCQARHTRICFSAQRVRTDSALHSLSASFSPLPACVVSRKHVCFCRRVLAASPLRRHLVLRPWRPCLRRGRPLPAPWAAPWHPARLRRRRPLPTSRAVHPWPRLS